MDRRTGPRLDAQALRRLAAGPGTQDLAALAALESYGKLTAAAAALDVAPASLSQRLKGLEQRLGLTLFKRTSTGMVPNHAGEQLLPAVHDVLQALEALLATQERLADDAQAARISISCPQYFGERYLEPALIEYVAAHPELVTHVEYSNRLHDLGRTPADVLLRGHRLFDGEPLPPYNHVARPVLRREMVLCAAPAWLARGLLDLSHPASLAACACLDLKMDVSADWSMSQSEWRLRHRQTGEITGVRVRISQSSNSAAALRNYALAGLGVALLPHDAVAAALEAGLLRRVFEDYELPALRICLIEQFRHRGRAQKELVAFLLQRFEALAGARP